MIVNYFGHKVFCIENDNNIILTNPWFTKKGAYFSTWYPYPKNYHLTFEIKEKMLSKNSYVYISSLDEDCYDENFMNFLGDNVTILLSPLLSNKTDYFRYKYRNIKILEREGNISYDNGLMIKWDNESFYYLEKINNNKLNVTTLVYDLFKFGPKGFYQIDKQFLENISYQNCILTYPPVFFYPDLYEKNIEYLSILDPSQNWKDDLDKYKSELEINIFKVIYDMKQFGSYNELRHCQTSIERYFKLFYDLLKSKICYLDVDPILVKVENVNTYYQLDFRNKLIKETEEDQERYIEFESYFVKKLVCQETTFNKVYKTLQVKSNNVDDIILQKIFNINDTECI